MANEFAPRRAAQLPGAGGAKWLTTATIALIFVRPQPDLVADLGGLLGQALAFAALVRTCVGGRMPVRRQIVQMQEERAVKANRCAWRCCLIVQSADASGAGRGDSSARCRNRGLARRHGASRPLSRRRGPARVVGEVKRHRGSRSDWWRHRRRGCQNGRADWPGGPVR